MAKIGLPVSRQTLNLKLGETDYDQHLPAVYQKLAVIRPSDRECAPKPASFDFFQLAMDQESIPQPGRTSVVYLGPHDNRAFPLAQHFAERVPHFLGEERPIRLDEPQVRDV